MTQTEQTTASGQSVGNAAGKGDEILDEACVARPEQAELIRSYFRHVPPEDRPRTCADLLDVIDAHIRTGRRRMPGEVKIRIFNAPQSGEGGWASTSTVVDLVGDDMPYVVDTVIGAITASGLTAHRVLHPILSVRRAADGELVEVTGESRMGGDPAGTVRESWVHVLVDRISDAERAERIEVELSEALAAVRAVVRDSAAITGAAAVAAAELRNSLSPRSSQEVTEAADLLLWLTAGNLTFLGHRVDEASSDGELHGVPGSGIGLMRDELPEAARIDEGWVNPGPEAGHLVITQMSAGSVMTRQVPPFAISIRILNFDGSVVRQHRFLGILTPRALNAEVTATPVLRRTAGRVLAALGAAPDSYTGQQAMNLLSTYPRAELFWAEPEQVLAAVNSVLQLSSRRRVRAFLQPDPYGRFISVLVYLPRDRYTTDRRLAMQDLLVKTLGGTDIRYTARVGDSLLAEVHFTVTTDPDNPVQLDDAGLAALNKQLRATIRSWEDRLVDAVVGGGDEDLDAAGALTRYADAFDESYKEDNSVDDAVVDLRRLDQLTGPDDLALAFAPSNVPDERRLKLYVAGATVTLSRALPVLQSMGAEVIDEKPYQVRRTDGTASRIYDFGLRFRVGQLPGADRVEEVRNRISESFIAGWRGQAEVDGFNVLVLGADLNWRQIAVLRAYAHYLRQIGSPYTQGYLEQVLAGNEKITADLAALFDARFDPDAFAEWADRERACAEITDRITAALDQVVSLDADRILRLYLALINATIRTNAFRTDENGNQRGTLALKLRPALIPGIPKPVPAFEIWVYSPRVEGVHLRFGAVARGGLRWSDRPEDFRTEILGLVKAQEVKNAVIVPVGAKGGFVLKQAPAPTGDPQADREALQAEGIACYRLFVASLLDVTDNRVAGDVVHPPRVVRHDEDDPYLVVAADKGTASFSDIANSVAADYGFWLDDAFASGGSAGYDHKGMGITARGAWESVKHHFRELGINTQTTDFTCVGVGDMSGDVFGNGMLLSEHIRLVAAFDHRHVFIDPTPDIAESFVERLRLFELPRSSWADYNTDLISTGGGVFPRTAKSIPITPQMRDALGLTDHVDKLTPTELIRAILLAPADLLWNGGIGTYIKASNEQNIQVGDKANDAVRVDGGDLRVKVVGEGGNLGVTQLGRIEFARNGGRINTDAIDNSAGVDTSDHEVNIKIALQHRMEQGDLDEPGRLQLLSSMTDEVADLVLADNKGQNRVLGASRLHAPVMLTVHSRLIDAMVESGRLDRALEFLPNHAQIHARQAAGEGLAGPELCVLLAYVKAGLSSAMLKGKLPDDPAFAHRLPEYFPRAMREGSDVARRAITEHPLAREIVTTETVNEMVNRAGLTFAFRLEEEMAATPNDAIRAYTIASTVFDLPTVWRQVAELDNRAPALTQDTIILRVRRLLDRAARWLLTQRPQPLDVRAEIERYAGPIEQMVPLLPTLVCGADLETVRAEIAELTEAGAPRDLAEAVAYGLHTYSLLDAVDVAAASGRDLLECAQLLYSLSAHLDFDHLLTSVTALERGDRWHALARQALRDDLYRSLRLLTADVLSTTSPEQDAQAKIEQWEKQNKSRLARARRTLGEISRVSVTDLAELSVAAREIRTMIR